ncbi:MAG: DsbE family thiol:disulfide interchange protein [Proteobacteria bacterium]|nr:DsbE family thiol:disulfide interchange protein [Pseudomonadota bacterium]
MDIQRPRRRTVIHAKTRHLVVSIVLILAATAVVGLLTRGLFVNVQKVPSALVGKPAADFQLPSIDATGEPVNLARFKGKPVILNFWASWCTSCREESEMLEVFWQLWKDKGIQVIGIAVQDTPEAAREFAQKAGKTFVLGIDETGKVGLDYGIYGVPETFFIDASGVIRYKEAGPLTRDVLVAEANRLMTTSSTSP